MKRVGRSVVSAMTQAPASGPFWPVTTPATSSASVATARAGVWPAPFSPHAATITVAARIAATRRWIALEVICRLLPTGPILLAHRVELVGRGRLHGDLSEERIQRHIQTAVRIGGKRVAVKENDVIGGYQQIDRRQNDDGVLPGPGEV